MSRDLNDTLVFVKVVELGSFTAAARALHLPKTTVSRKVQELEQRLGAQLLHRTTRKLGLTEAGNIYFAHCQRIARDIDEAESAVGQLQSGPRGWLRVTATHAMGNIWVAPLLSEFHARHPEVRVELLLSNDKLDIIAGEIDVAMRVGTLADSNLAARRLSVLRTAVYAAPGYIERFGAPLHPDDLIHHRALALTSHRNVNAFTWTLGDGNGKPRDFPVDPVMISNDPGALRAVLLGGEGIMLASDAMVRAYVEQGLVQRALAGWRGLDIDLHALFPRGQVQSPKVRAFVDFLVERLRVDENYVRVLSDGTPALPTVGGGSGGDGDAPGAAQRGNKNDPSDR
ncbi:LysR family transcriptional regulator [Luteimonas salinilitoris]|uniref:LysR substrate-binding domain-containing protein n=1 Tax=Luteimonas salinilitoris TaxID=3237697 RepID=A0ABV4HT66_9GAMM